MLVLHGSWLPARGAHSDRFVLWGETTPAGRTRGRRRREAATARPHPFAVTVDVLRAALAGQGISLAPEPEPVEVLARLPTINGAPLPSPDLADGQNSADREGLGLTAWRVPGLAFPAAQAPELLLALANEASRTPDLTVGDDTRFWTATARFALALIAGQRLLPALEPVGGAYRAGWRPLLDAERDAERFGTLARSLPPVGRALAWEHADPEPRPRDLLADFLSAVVDGLARSAAAPLIAQSATRRPPRGRAARPRSVATAWLEALAGDPIVQAAEADLTVFSQQYHAWAEPPRDVASGTDSFRVCFRLDPPLADPEGDRGRSSRAPARDWSVEYLLQATDDPSLIVPAADVWRQRGTTARFLNRRFDNPQERLLAGLGRAARLIPALEASLRSARPEAARLSTEEAHEFVREKALLLRSSGFGVLVPGLETKLGLRVRIGGSPSAPGKASGPATFGWNSLVNYDWEVALGDETLTRAEFEVLARLKEPLVQVRGRWIELRPDQIEQALAFFQKQADGQLALPDALKLALAPDGESGLPIVDVATEGWIDDLLGRVRDGAPREEVEEPPGFSGQLRPYQKAGLAWLAALRRYGLGACLADDMGLGKTIQLIALLLHQRAAEPDPAPSLLICPTSVVGNWQRELARFAPSLKVLIHHGADRVKADFGPEAARHDLVISTYALLHRDESELAGVAWSAVVLDEAQNIKNALTKAAQAARRLPARWRAALTGTPVENRLADLWSIFQFLNPGYLGSAEEFRKRFAGPIERAKDVATAARLKALVGPFILRRVKTDRSIIQDLPEKNEMKVYCTLTREQGTLYEAVVQDSLHQIEASEGIQRRGLVLATLTKLKQVCNHPTLFLHDGSELAGRSGKLIRLGEMLDEVVTVGDRALIFTQYAEMGRLLKSHLEGLFGREVLFLHGGTPAKGRDQLVARFQSDGRGPQIFVLSIKAGGTGLNLTRANHVFHFDRWWNPAVENQATDRAFRIGQRRDVQVHKYLCAGTFEEVLDQLIERKIELSEAIVGASEGWITELSTDQLRDLFTLRRDALAGSV